MTMSEHSGPDYVPPIVPQIPPAQQPAEYLGSILPGGGGSASGDLLSSGHIERTRRNVPAILLSVVAVLALIGGGVFYVNHMHKKVSSAGAA